MFLNLLKVFISIFIMNKIKSIITPIKIKSYETFSIEPSKRILFEYENIDPNDNKPEIIIYFEPFYNLIEEFTKLCILRNISYIDIEINDTSKKICFEGKEFITENNFEIILNAKTEKSINTGKGIYYIYLTGLIKGYFYIFNLDIRPQLNYKISKYYRFDYWGNYSQKIIYYEIPKLDKNQILNYQIIGQSEGKIDIYENEQIIYSSNTSSIEDQYVKLEKDKNYLIKYTNPESFVINFDEHIIKSLLLDGNIIHYELNKMQKNYFLIDISKDENNSYIYFLMDNIQELSLKGKFYDTLDKDKIYENLPKTESEYDFLYDYDIQPIIPDNIIKTNNSFVSLLITFNYSNNIFIKRLPNKVNIKENIIKKNIKKKEVYYYQILKSDFKQNKKKVILYSNKLYTLDIFPGTKIKKETEIITTKFFVFNLNESDYSIILNGYDTSEDFIFELKLIDDINLNLPIDIMSIETDNYFEKRIFIDDCSKDNFYILKTPVNFVFTYKIIKGDIDVYSFESLNNVSIDDIYPPKIEKMKIINYPKINNEKIEFLGFKCKIPSIIELYYIENEFISEIVDYTFQTLYLNEEEFVEIDYNYPSKFELIFINEKKDSEVLLSFVINDSKNEKKYKLNKNNTYIYYDNNNTFQQVKITGLKSKSIILISGSKPTNTLLIDKTGKYNISENMMVIVPNNNITQYGKISIIPNSNSKIEGKYYFNYGKNPYYSFHYQSSVFFSLTKDQIFTFNINKPFGNLGKRKIESDEDFYFEINTFSGSGILDYVIINEDFQNEIKENSIFDINIDKNFVYQISKCSSKKSTFSISNKKGKIIDNNITSKYYYKLINNENQDNYLFNISTNISLLFRFTELSNKNYTLNITKDFNLSINDGNIEFNPLMKENVEYSIIIVENDEIENLNDDCYINKLINNKLLSTKNFEIIKFDDDGLNNKIKKYILNYMKDNINYIINVLALQKNNSKMIISYNPINYIKNINNSSNIWFYILIFLLCIILIIIIIIIVVRLKKYDEDLLIEHNTMEQI